MAELIAMAILSAFEISATAAVIGSITALTVTTAIVGVGITVGVSLLAQSFLSASGSATGGGGRSAWQSAGRPPSDHQFVSKSTVGPRLRSYGRVRISGAQIFLGASGGTLYRVLAHNDGQIDGVEEHLIDDTLLTIGGDGWATAPATFAGLVNVQTRDGRANPAQYTTLTAAFPDWDATHLGKGVAHSLTLFAQVAQSAFFDTYPSGENTIYKQTLRGARVWDPRLPAQTAEDPATWAWSDNAALVILDYLRHETGMAMPMAWLAPELAGWIEAANACDDPIALAAGGTEPRYRVWGTYSLDERPADVLSRMLTACNGRLWIGPSGGLAISVGVWTTPALLIGDDAIVGYKIGSGNERPETANTIAAVFTSPAQGYVECDAALWVNEAAAAQFGEQRADARLYMVPSHSQCRRLMKQVAARLAPAWKGTITTNLAALPVLSERWVRIQIAEMDLDITAEVENVQFKVEKGNVVTGLIIEFVSADAATWDWNATEEEDTPSSVPPAIAASGLAGPANFGISIEARASGGASNAVAVASWNAFSAPGMRVQLEYKTGGVGSWLLAPQSSEGATSAETPPLTDGGVYQFRARTIGLTRASPYTAEIARTVTVDSTPPDVPVALSTTQAGSAVTVVWTNPNSANVYGARVYRHAANAASAATLIATRYAGAGSTRSIDDTGLGTGTYWYWVAAMNGSGVESARTAAGTETIT